MFIANESKTCHIHKQLIYVSRPIFGIWNGVEWSQKNATNSSKAYINRCTHFYGSAWKANLIYLHRVPRHKIPPFGFKRTLNASANLPTTKVREETRKEARRTYPSVEIYIKFHFSSSDSAFARRSMVERKVLSCSCLVASAQPNQVYSGMTFDGTERLIKQSYFWSGLVSGFSPNGSTNNSARD